MKILKLPILLLAVGTLSACLGNIDLKPGSYRKLPEGVELSPSGTLLAQGTVVGISDGDTLTVLGKDKKTYKIRLQGIDAPEKKQDYGQKCKESLMMLTANLPVEVEAYKQDRYGRIVAKITAKGKDVALEQIRIGCGWHYTAYAQEQNASDRKAYAAAEKAARKARLGLWHGKSPQAPWDYRHGG